jgi:hypothetical protein
MTRHTRQYLIGCLLTIVFYAVVFLIAATPANEVPYRCDARDAC